LLKKPEVPVDNESANPSTLTLTIVPYNDPVLLVEEDHIDNNLNTSPVLDVDDSFQLDMFDPRYWDSLNPKQIDILAEKGPRRDLSIKKGPIDRYRRLNDLATISLESEVLEKLHYKDIMEDFISKNPKKMMLFK
jgi:hypothetical protein